MGPPGFEPGTTSAPGWHPTKLDHGPIRGLHNYYLKLLLRVTKQATSKILVWLWTVPRCTLKISAVVPTYNEEENIKRCLTSLRKQRIEEIIVVDGGSRDKTVEIARSFADKVISSRELNTVARARMEGIRQATGDVIAFVDADTVVSRTWREGIEESFSDKDVVAATGPAYPLEEPRFLITLGYIISYDILIRLTLAIGRPHFMGFNSAYRADVLKKVKIPDVKVSEDALLSMAVYPMGTMVFNKKMAVYTSFRRVKKRGWSETIFYLLYNGLKVILTGEPFEEYAKV